VLFYSGNKTQGVCPSGGSHDANANKPYIALYDYLRFDTGEIAFDNGVSITGAYYGYMRPTGGYWFGGHFHNGLPIPYDVSAMMAVKSSSGKVFTFTHKLSLGGWGGDQDGSWSISGTNPAIASAWDDLKKDDHVAWDAQANCDFGVLWSDIKSAIGTITEVIGIVGAALA